MAFQPALFYIIFLILNEITANKNSIFKEDTLPTIITPNETTNCNSSFEIEKDYNEFYNVTYDSDNSTEIIQVNITKKTCDNMNYSADEIDESEEPAKKLNSVYLNNIYSRVTTNLIEDAVSIDNLEQNGVNLHEVVGSDCGASKVCVRPAKRKAITIGFLGAYGRSQVSHAMHFVSGSLFYRLSI